MKAPKRTLAGKLESGRANKREQAILTHFGKQIQQVEWDFDLDGGATGDILFDVELPANSIVTGVTYDVLTVTDGATDSETFKLVAGSTDLMDADAQPSGTGPVAAGLSAGYPVKLSASSPLKLTIAGEAATQGNIRFYVEFIEQI